MKTRIKTLALLLFISCPLLVAAATTEGEIQKGVLATNGVSLLLSLVPLVLFAALFFEVARRLLKAPQFRLNSLFNEKDTKGISRTASETPANGPGDPADNQAANSSSRVLVFFSGMAAIIISICMSCFYLGYYLYTGTAPEFDGLLKLLAGLGIGVIPYLVNKAKAQS